MDNASLLAAHGLMPICGGSEEAKAPMQFVYCTDTGDWSDRVCPECDGEHTVVDIPPEDVYPKFLLMLRAIRSAYWVLDAGGSMDVMDRLNRCFTDVTGLDIEGETAS